MKIKSVTQTEKFKTKHSNKIQPKTQELNSCMLSNGIWERLEIFAFYNYTRILFLCNYVEPLCTYEDTVVPTAQSSLMRTFWKSGVRHVRCQGLMLCVQNWGFWKVTQGRRLQRHLWVIFYLISNWVFISVCSEDIHWWEIFWESHIQLLSSR